MEEIDNFFSITTSSIFLVLKYIFFPFKLIFKYVTSYFERPYSFCFILNFLILIVPCILLTVLLIQNYEIINSVETFNFIFYITLMNLVVNYILVFHIYYLYGQHRLEDNTEEFNIKTYSKFIFGYLFRDTLSGYIGIYFIMEVGFGFYSLNHIYYTKDYHADTFYLPVLTTFTLIGICLNLTFTLMHVIMFGLVYLLTLCYINNSCLCKILTDCCCKRDSNLIKLNNEDTKFEDNRNSFRSSFNKMGMEFFKFFGVYDYEKQLKIVKQRNIINV